jgi:hypothetical protein
MVSGRDRVGRAGYFCEVPRVFARKQAFFRVDEEMCLEGFFNKEGFYTMSNFLKSLFGAKKAAKVAKSKMQTRRLELIGLEERVTPAAFTLSGQTVVATLAAGESLTAISSSIAAGGLVTINVTSSLTNSVTGTGLAQPTAGVAGAPSVITFTPTTATSFTGISILGSTGTETVAISGAVDLNTNGPTAASFSVGTSVESLTVAGAISSKAANIDLAATAVTLGANLTANTSGTITVTGPSTLSANVTATTTGTGAAALISLGTVTGAFNLTTSSGAGNVSVGALTGLGAVSITSTGTIGLTGAVTAASVTTVGAGAVTLGGTVTTTGLVNFGGAVTGTGGLTVNSGAAATFTGAVDTSSSNAINVVAVGDLTFSSTVGASQAFSVNAKSTTGDVSFGAAVTTRGIGGFTSEATLATKATKIADVVNVQAGANALVTGNLITNNATNAVIAVAATGTINITGKVDAATANNNLGLEAVNGAITIGGAVGSSAVAMGVLFADGNTSFSANGTVTVGNLVIGDLAPFATSINFAEAVKVTGADSSVSALTVNALSTGTITFAKTIEVTNAAASIDIGSVNGLITVTGNITGKDSVSITTSGSGAITLSGAISTDAADGDILIESTSGNVITSGAISTSGTASGANSADINIDTATSGNITIGGNVSTSGGGDIILGADSTSLVSGTGNLTINGTVTTTGTAAGDIAFGIAGGTGAINKAVTAGATGDVIFINSLATDAYTIASGANISAGDNVLDAIISGGAFGIINLGANITALNGSATSTLGVFGIGLDNSINLTGAVSMKAAGTGGDIGLANVNGAQNLTLESTDQIVLGSVGQTTALSLITVTNSAGVSAGAFTAAKVVLTDTTGTVAFGGPTVITNSLTTAAKAYGVTFAGTSVLSGAPVFLNTGNVSFAGTTSLTTGATITGTAATTVNLAGTIVSGGAFNIGALPATTTVANATQLILNSTTAASNFAGKVVSAGTGANALSLLGVGTLTLSGDSSSSGVTGDINVINGTLNVTGKLGSANVTSATSGTITGAGGTIGALTVNTGTVAPGGTLNTGAVTLNAATNYSAAVLTTTTAANLKTASAINLGGATLSLSSVAAGLAVNNTFTIIDNTAVSGLVTGTFANQPEGSSISAKDTAGNTVTFTVSYIGGTNANDVTLKVSSITSATPTPTAPAQPMVAGQPALNKFTAVGADAGGGPLVTITFQNGTFVSFFAYASTFTGGVRVALGDVNGDGSTDVITGAGPGGGPQVNVYNVNNATGVVSLQKSFFAFSAPSFTGGVYVAAGNTNGDAFADVIVGAGATGGSRVQVYAGSATGVVTTSTLNDFFAYSPAFTGGVVVAAGQRDAVAGDEIITAPASGGGYNIKSFNANGTGNNPTVVDNFFAFNNTTSVGGLSLAVGLLNSGSIADLIVGTTNGGYGVIVDSATAGIAGVPFAGFTGAIRAGVAEDANGQDFAVALAGPTGAPRISVFSVGATALTQTDSLFVMNTGFTGGLFGTPTLPATIVVA